MLNFIGSFCAMRATINTTSMLFSQNQELLVVRRPHCDHFSMDDYTPCPMCKGWYFKCAIAVHVNHRCVVQDEGKMKSSSILQKSHHLKFDQVIDTLDSEVFSTMRKDGLHDISIKDNIIRRVGSYYLEKHRQNRLRCKSFSSKRILPG